MSSEVQVAVGAVRTAQVAHEEALTVVAPLLMALRRAEEEVWSVHGLLGPGYDPKAEAALKEAQAKFDAAHKVAQMTQQALQDAKDDLMVAVVMAAMPRLSYV